MPWLVAWTEFENRLLNALLVIRRSAFAAPTPDRVKSCAASPRHQGPLSPLGAGGACSAHEKVMLLGVLIGGRSSDVIFVISGGKTPPSQELISS